MVKRLVLFLIFSLSLPVLALNRLEVSVDKNPVLAGEYFVLTLTADDSVSGGGPDTSALLKDFVVGPTSTSSQTSIVNGNITRRTSWKTELMARTPGDINIPSFELQGVKSAPFTLKVIKQSAAPGQAQDAFVEVSMQPETLFVQQAGVYTVKLYLARELADGDLTAPALEDAQVSLLGKQKEDYEIKDGKRYLVITRDYLIQPQKSGDYRITPPAFNGRMRKNYRTLGVSALGDELTLTVKPIPADYQGAWLPSELVDLSEEWQPAEQQVEVGTPITRTITLTALGVTKEQLPEITLKDIQGIRSYPDQNERKHVMRDGRVISQQIASFALLPQKAGEYVLPEISVPWFNTKTGRVEYATLPERRLTVVAGEGHTQTAAAPSPTDSTSPQQQPATQNGLVTVQTEPGVNPFIAAGGYLLWLITLAAWFLLSKRTAKKPNQSRPSPAKHEEPLHALKKTAKAGNAAEFYRALSVYAEKRTGDKVSPLDTLSKELAAPEFNERLAELKANLYGGQNGEVDLEALLVLLQSNKRAAKHAGGALPPLHGPLSG